MYDGNVAKSLGEIIGKFQEAKELFEKKAGTATSITHAGETGVQQR
jgi:hypothetical protein